MKALSNFLTAAILVSSLLVAGNKPNHLLKHSGSKSSPALSFIENKGQVHDQSGNSRQDVLYSATDGQLVVHLKRSGMSYQIGRIDSWRESPKATTKTGFEKETKMPGSITLQRIDIDWMNTSGHTSVISGKALDGYTNYFNESCPDGALNVKSYDRVIYKELYKGVDLKWYQKDGQLKYDYLVEAGADYKAIRLQFKGAEKIVVNNKGELVISTALGDIIEQAPLVKQQGKLLKSRWEIGNNIANFAIEGADPRFALVIDPFVRAWGTFYGGPGANTSPHGTTASDNTVDNSGNVYISGTTESSSNPILIATSGAFQATMSGSQDAYLAKFDPSGSRLWATYYGGSPYNSGGGCVADPSGNVYLSGYTSAASGIASTGAHQAVFGGVYDAFLVKFTSSGARIWSTYYGGSDQDMGAACALDASGNIYLTGITWSTNGIATTGGHQTANGSPANGGDGFLVKFNSAGVRQWGTYYGGSDQEFGTGIATDVSLNVYLSGYTRSLNNIATPGSYQAAHGGGNLDGYLAKFNASGVRQWATYYGGSAGDIVEPCATDAAGNVYIGGNTSSSGSVIASPGAPQTIVSGVTDGFVAKFDGTGARFWATLFGGDGGENLHELILDAAGKIYIGGSTSSTLGLATGGAHQATFGGGPDDGYVAQLDAYGNPLWASYYGTSDADVVTSCAIDNSGTSLYIFGQSTNASGTGTALATAGSYEPTFPGGYQSAFLAKFTYCDLAITTPLANQFICAGNSTTLSAAGGSTSVQWYQSAGSTSVISTNTFATPVLSGGIYTYYIGSAGCGSGLRIPITVTVSAQPTISVSNGAVCIGESFTLNPTGASSYTFSGGSAVVSPTATTSYTITGSNGVCAATSTAVSTIAVNTLPLITINSGTVCAGSAFVFYPAGALSYTFPGGIQTVSPTVTTSYTITGANINGCVSSAVSTVSMGTVIPVFASASYSAICAEGSTTLTASGANSYLWSTGSTQTVIVVTPLFNATYSVSGTTGSCNGSASLSIQVVSSPASVLSASNSACDNSVTCSGAVNAVTTGGTGAYSYSLNSGSCSGLPCTGLCPGLYTLYTYNSIGCSTFNIFSIACNTVLGIASNALAHPVSIYPNPNNGQFVIEAAEPMDIKVYDSLGQFLFAKHIDTGKTQVDMSGYANGLYFVCSANLMQKIVKE